MSYCGPPAHQSQPEPGRRFGKLFAWQTASCRLGLSRRTPAIPGITKSNILIPSWRHVCTWRCAHRAAASACEREPLAQRGNQRHCADVARLGLALQACAGRNVSNLPAWENEGIQGRITGQTSALRHCAACRCTTSGMNPYGIIIHGQQQGRKPHSTSAEVDIVAAHVWQTITGC